MKKLSEFKDEQAIEVIAKLLLPIASISSRGVNAEGKTMAVFASELLSTSPREVKEILAILNETEPEEYHCTAATVLVDVITMLGDKELLRLFASQGQTTGLKPSGSASENTQAPGQ